MAQIVDYSELREIVKDHFDATKLLLWDRKEEKELELYFERLVRGRACKHTLRLPNNTPDKFLESLVKLKSLKYVEIFFKENSYGGVYNLMDLARFDRLDIVHYLLSRERIYICQKTAEAVCNMNLIRQPKYIELLRQMITTGDGLTPPVLSWKKGFINRMLLRWEKIAGCDYPLETVMVLNDIGFPLDGEGIERVLKKHIEEFRKCSNLYSYFKALDKCPKPEVVEAWLKNTVFA